MKKFNHAFSIQLIVLFFALIVPAISAQTFEVTRTDDPVPDGCNSGTDCSLREAIIAANDVGSGTATIQLVGGQTYTLSIVNPTPEDDFDSPDETAGSLKVLNADATVRIEATGSGMATIDADDIDRVFIMYAGTDVEIDEIEITGGNPENGRGGGIFVLNNDNLEITNSSITGNTAIDLDHASEFGYGGGMWAEGVTMTITGSTISNNTAGFQGGGLRIIRYNEEVTINSDVTIENSTISNNDGGQYGGGIFSERADLTITESTISDNQVTFVGGGIRISLDGNLNIDRSTIGGNTGGLGGGLDIGGGEALIINSTISGNVAENFNGAGGINVGNFSDPVVDIVNTTITNNTSGTIGGVINGTGGGVINFSNSIVANQNGVADDCSGTMNSDGYNIESETTCGFTATGDLQNSDPLLGPLQDNGGPVFTHAITGPLSPAVNNGSNTLYTDAGGSLATDSDANGNDRVYDFDSGGIIDIGAFELQQDVIVEGCPVTHEDNILFVKKGDSGTGANWADALGELRDALALFEDETCTTEDVDEIWVTAGTYLPTDDSGDREATFLMPGVNIYGGFEGDETNTNQRDLDSNISILSGEINGDDNLSGNSYHVVTSMDESSGVLFDFTITGGNANGSDPHDKGGGLYASNGGIGMSNILFENNYAETAGGGAYVIETVERIGAQHPKFTRTTFRNNESGTDGGGLALEDAKSRITSVLFENNSADRYGGGIFMDQSSPVIKNVFFTNNYSNSQGGAIATNSSSPELYNVEFTQNKARFNGGAIDHAFSGTLSLYNGTMYGNEAEETATEFSGNGGGIYNRNGAELYIHNSIIWGNSAALAGNEIWNADPSSAELFYSLYGNEPGDIVVGGGFTASNSLTTDPLFEDAPGGDVTLTNTSPAINTGDPGTDLSDFKIFGSDEIDLAENPRVYNGDVNIIDMGAYEFQGNPDVEEPEFAPFITTWEVEAGDLQITIPTAAGQTYSYDVDWGDGESDTGLTGDASHTYDSADTYTVKITGTFPQIEFFNADDKDKILSVEQWGDIEWASMRKAFQGATMLEINASDTPDLSNATSMLEMFSGATSVNGGLENWDVSTITSMFGVFDGATSFNGDISGWDVSAATDMIRMFAGATAFDQDIGEWEVDNVSTMESMFDGASSFNQDLSEWNTGNVGGMLRMFTNAAAFNQNLGNWDIEDVTSMSSMLDGSGLSQENYDNTLIGWESQSVQNDVEVGADGLEYCAGKEEREALINDHNWSFIGDSEAADCGSAEFAPFITTWQTDNPGDSDDQSIRIPMIGNGYDFNVDWGDGNDEDYNTNPGDGIEHFLEHTYATEGEYEVKITGDFPRIYFNNSGDKEKILSVEQWGNIAWSSMERGFIGASNMNVVAEDAPDLSNVESMASMFGLAASMNGDINHWNTETVTDMKSMFDRAASFNQDLDNWKTDNVTSMRSMFQDASEFNGDISSWQTGNVTTMNQMFDGATAFNSDIGDWDVRKVENMGDMFEDAVSFNQDISGWQIDALKNAHNMFDGAASFNQDISGWDVSKVAAMDYMFRGATSFNQDISGWQTEALTRIEFMFQNATSFNQDISGWDVSKVTNMRFVFRDATAFDQDLSDWDISGVENMTSMFDNSGMSTQNYDATLIGWESQSVMNDVALGADGLTYCNGKDARQALMDDHNWDITGDALAGGCDSVEGEDRRILAGNLPGQLFSGSDFGIANEAFSVKIETLPGEGELLFEGSPVAAGDKLSVADLNDDKLVWNPTPDSDEYGYNFTSFDFTIVDDGDVESEESYTMTIDVGAAFVELTGGEGWRFLANPSMGDTYGGFLDPLWTKGVPGSDNPGSPSSNLYMLNQEEYEWEKLPDLGNDVTRGQAFLVYVYSDNDNNGTPDGFPKMLTSGQNWEPLDNEFSYNGLAYDPGQGSEGDSHYLIGNPHPIALDFCGFTGTHVANSLDFWNPNANGGNGDYVNLSCASGDVFIAPFQSFWIRTTDANPVLEIPETAYLGSVEEGYFKQGEPSDRYVVTLTVSDQDQVFTNTAHILFSEEGTSGLDTWDAPKLSPAGLANRWLSFYSLGENNRSYALQSLPDDFQEKVRIPFDIQTTESGRYTLDWSLPESQVFGGSYFLRDNVSGQVIELHEGASYSFEITEVEKTKDTPLPPLDRGGFLAKTQAAGQPSDRLERSDGFEPRFELLIAASGVDGFTELGAVPEAFELAQNYPNPFNPTTVISYQLPVNSEVRLEVYDMLGRRVAQLVNGQVAAGRHTVNFDASGLSSGIYLYRLAAGSTIMTRKLTVVK